VSFVTHAFVFQVEGSVKDRDGNAKWVVSGTWGDQVDIAPVLSTERVKGKEKPNTGPYTTVWKRKNHP
jgi:hypothetical protein